MLNLTYYGPFGATPDTQYPHPQGLLQAFFIKAHPIQDWVKTQDKIEFFLERIKAVQRP